MTEDRELPSSFEKTAIGPGSGTRLVPDTDSGIGLPAVRHYPRDLEAAVYGELVPRAIPQEGRPVHELTATGHRDVIADPESAQAFVSAVALPMIRQRPNATVLIVDPKGDGSDEIIAAARRRDIDARSDTVNTEALTRGTSTAQMAALIATRAGLERGSQLPDPEVRAVVRDVCEYFVGEETKVDAPPLRLIGKAVDVLLKRDRPTDTTFTDSQKFEMVQGIMPDEEERRARTPELHRTRTTIKNIYEESLPQRGEIPEAPNDGFATVHALKVHDNGNDNPQT